MKYIVAIFLTFIISGSVNAQINNIWIIPPNPTTTDTVKVVVDATIGNTPCHMISSSVSQSGGNITVNVEHFAGMLPAICNSTDTVTLGVLSAGAYTLTYNLTVGFSTGTATEQFTITQSGPVTPIISGPSDVCLNDSAVYQIDNVETGVSYQWSCSGQATCSGSDTLVTVHFGSPGSATIEATSTDSNGSTTGSTTVNVHPAPEAPLIGSPGNLCENTNSEFEVLNYDSLFNYIWSCSGSAECANETGKTANVQLTGSVDSAHIQVTATSPFGCGSEITDTAFYVNQPPAMPGITGPNSACDKDTLTYSVDQHDMNLSYEWSCFGSASCFGETGATAEVKFNGTDSSAIQLTATSQEGCQSDANVKSVNVNPLPETPVILGPSDACAGDTLSYLIPNYDPEFNYTWECHGPAHCMSTSGAKIDIVFADTDNQANISVKATSPHGCGEATINKNVEVNMVPETPTIDGPAQICSPDSATYSISNFDPSFNYQWICSGSAMCQDDNSQNMSVHFSGSDSAFIEVIATSPDGCGEKSVRKTIEVHPIPVMPSLSGPNEVCNEDTPTYTIDHFDQDFNYTWSCSGSAHCLSTGGEVVEIYFSGEDSAVIEVSAISPEGCGVKTYSKKVHIHPVAEKPVVDGPDEVCSGDMVTYTLSNYNEEFTYTWDCSGSANCVDEGGDNAHVWFSGTDTAIINVSVTSPENCGDAETTFKANVLPVPTTPEIEGPENLLVNSTEIYSVVNYNPAFMYEWNCSGAADCAGEVGEEAAVNFTMLDSAFIEVTASNNCGVQKAEKAVLVEYINAVYSDNRAVSHLEIYPQPNNGKFNVEFELTSVQNVNISIYDLTGRIIHAESFENASGLFSQTLVLDTTPGVYILKVVTGNEVVEGRVMIRGR